MNPDMRAYMPHHYGTGYMPYPYYGTHMGYGYPSYGMGYYHHYHSHYHPHSQPIHSQHINSPIPEHMLTQSVPFR